MVSKIITTMLLPGDWLPLVLKGSVLILGSILAVIGLYFGITAVLRRLAIHQYQTPYDIINKRIQDPHNIIESKDKFYDFFVSYKSDDAMKIRPLVEQMLASGVNVWFAEYNIKLEGREAFERAIATGIAHSKYGLCFTNDQYAASKYCCDELEQLLAPKNCGMERVIEIGFPLEPLPHQRYPQLEAVNSICYDGNINALIDQINQITGFAISSVLPKQPASPVYRTFRYGNKQYQLDFDGWTLTAEETPIRPDGEAAGPMVERICGGYQIRGYLHIGTSIAFPRANHQTDDRDNYEYGIGFARVHYAQLPAHCIGVHLFFLEGLSHIALTSRGIFGWCRTYSVIIPVPGTGQQVEFLFDFYIQSPFSDFCRCTHHMDRIVQSLEWM